MVNSECDHVDSSGAIPETRMNSIENINVRQLSYRVFRYGCALFIDC